MQMMFRTYSIFTCMFRVFKYICIVFVYIRLKKIVIAETIRAQSGQIFGVSLKYESFLELECLLNLVTFFFVNKKPLALMSFYLLCNLLSVIWLSGTNKITTQQANMEQTWRKYDILEKSSELNLNNCKQRVSCT